jgi:hypothetical protein
LGDAAEPAAKAAVEEVDYPDEEVDLRALMRAFMDAN